MSLFRQILSTLLIAVMASGVLTVPALRHSHVIEQTANPVKAERSPTIGHHHHHHHSHVGHGHQHDQHEHSNDRTSHDDSDAIPLAPDVEHVHVVFFGFELALPCDESDSGQSSPLGDCWFSLVGDLTPVLPVVEVSASVGLHHFPWVSASAVVARDFRASGSPPKWPPLSAFARHQRPAALRV